jgi:hypothetical protein
MAGNKRGRRQPVVSARKKRNGPFKGPDVPDAWWDVETEFFIKERDCDPHMARTIVILRWMGHGDFRPLIAAIDAGHNLDKAVLNALALMLEGDKRFPARLQPLLHRRGRAMRPENWIRNLTAAREYEAEDGKSDEVFAYIAKTIGKSDRTVRQAVTAFRKKR